MNEQIKSRVMKRLVGSFGIIIAVVVAVIVCLLCVYKVDPGYNATVFSVNSGLKDETLTPGWHILWPWEKATSYPVSTEVFSLSKDDGKSVQVSTSDGKVVDADLTLSFHVNPEHLPKVFEKFRGQSVEQIENGYMKSELLRCINEVTSQYNLMQLIGDSRAKANQQVFEKLRQSLDECGITLETCSISGIVPDEATAESIAKVVAAQNELERAKIEKQTAEVEAQKKVAAANGEANSVLVKAKAEAEANRLLQESLTENVIREHAIQRWDGKMPQVNGGGNMLFNIPVDK